MTMRDCDGVNFPIDIGVVSIMLWFIDDKIDWAVTLTLLKLEPQRCVSLKSHIYGQISAVWSKFFLR